MVNYDIIGYVTYNRNIVCYIVERKLENKDVVFKPFKIDINKTILELKSVNSILENDGMQTNFRVTQDKKIVFTTNVKKNLKNANLKFFYSEGLQNLTHKVNTKLGGQLLSGCIEEMGYNLYNQVPYYMGRTRDLTIKVYRMINNNYTVYIQRRIDYNNTANFLRCTVKGYDTLVDLIYEMVR